MARIVIGVGTSHSPQLSTDPEIWHLHAQRDRDNPGLIDSAGRVQTYAQLAAQAPAEIRAALTAPAQRAMATQAESALARLREALSRCAPDVVIVIGDDQDELFGPEAIPAFALYTGDEVWDRPPEPEVAAALPPGIAEAQWAQHAKASEAYLVPRELSEHLARELTTSGFDMCVCSAQAENRSLGHAFTFVRLRLELPREIPVLPLSINTYFPPNVPSPQRCDALGRALHAAVESWPESARVAIVASGGLSHFVVDEALDREVLTALAAQDVPRASAAADGKMLSGTSEILNWIMAAGALKGLNMELVDYIPAYRTLAGTGVGLAFALWHEAADEEG